jgi:hypothetical protein
VRSRRHTKHHGHARGPKAGDAAGVTPEDAECGDDSAECALCQRVVVALVAARGGGGGGGAECAGVAPADVASGCARLVELFSSVKIEAAIRRDEDRACGHLGLCTPTAGAKGTRVINLNAS